MPTFIKTAGVWTPVKSMFFKQNGQWLPIQRGYTKVAGAWVEVFSAAVTAIVAATTTNLNVETLFSVADWQDPLKKKIVHIPTGVIVGSANPAIAALLTGTGRGGELEIIIDGEIRGAGGAPNGGAGGPAINVQQTGAVITNNGAIRGGGGGGGKGGAGTATTTTNRQPASGQSYAYNWDGSPSTFWNNISSADRFIHWNSVGPIATGIPLNATFYDLGGYRYYRGTLVAGALHGVWREQITTASTVGGNGGRGQGHDGAASAGAAGGTNAGTGGAGGAWGTNGSTGTNGNAGSGLAGGIAGPALTGQARTFINNGTVNGAAV